MIDMDEQYRHDGRWIFTDPCNRPMSRDETRRGRDQETDHSNDRVYIDLTEGENGPASERVISEGPTTVLPILALDTSCAESMDPIDYSYSPAAPAPIEPKDLAGEPRLEMLSMSMPVNSLRSLGASARLWTSPETAAIKDKEGCAIIQYKHGHATLSGKPPAFFARGNTANIPKRLGNSRKGALDPTRVW